MAKSKITNHNGAPAITVDGVAFSPMTMLADNASPEYIKKLGEAGIRIFYLISSMRWNTPGSDCSLDGVTLTLDGIKRIVDIIPDAYIILRLNV